MWKRKNTQARRRQRKGRSGSWFLELWLASGSSFFSRRVKKRRKGLSQVSKDLFFKNWTLLIAVAITTLLLRAAAVRMDFFLFSSSSQLVILQPQTHCWLAVAAAVLAHKRLKYLEYGETRLRESVKVTPWVDGFCKLSTKDLHPEQGENENEEEQNNEQGINGRDGVDQGLDQVPHGGPVSRNKRVGKVGAGDRTLEKITAFFHNVELTLLSPLGKVTSFRLQRKVSSFALLMTF